MNYFIKTFGCQMNFSDSERILSYLNKLDLVPTDTITSADLVIFNTCGVRQTAEDRVYGQIHNLRKANHDVIIVVTGCLALRKDVQRKLSKKVDAFLSINKIHTLFNKVALRKKIKKSESYRHYLDLLPKYKDKNSILVPIMTGCNNFCSYCVVPYARGKEWSRPIDEIVDEVERAFKEGCKKILLLGQNVNSYDYNNQSFSKLLNTLATSYQSIEFSFLTSHPKDFSDDLIETIKNNPNISRSIHLPIQSGSDKILALMNRRYTRQHYLEIIKKIKKELSDAVFSTDVIVGFPGETLNDFKKTVSVFKKVDFSDAFINKYSPRPGTAAEKLGDPIPWDEKKKRERELRSFLAS